MSRPAAKRNRTDPHPSRDERRPNILLIMVDQMRFPRFAYGPDHGFVEPLKDIFGFQGSAHDNNAFKKYFPGLWALRDNAVVLRNHRCASSACVPSRTALFSGQYGTVTRATQTDGGFKNGADPAFPWLDPEKFPTIGDWMQQCGYTTHYFGKWHVSGEATTDLEGYGFTDWELSYPDPHGTLPNNLGHYRDHQFADLVTSFLRRQGLGVPYSVAHARYNTAQASESQLDDKLVDEPDETATPWFAVASFTNPHDIASYPALPRTVYGATVENAPYTLAVPPQGAIAELPAAGTMGLVLNRRGFPQNNAEVAPTWNESLANKPDCQLDYAYKMGLTLMAKAGWSLAMADDRLTCKREQLEKAVELTLRSNLLGLPLALTENPELACRAFMQYYGYAIQEVDQHIDAVLRALEESGQADNTIVIFTPDHGEYGGAHHMMTEKWHSSYDEFVHIPMVVRFPASMHVVPGGLRQVDEPTSHIDILPTILGLAGVRASEMEQIRQKLVRTHENSYQPVGADLSQLVLNRQSAIVDADTGRPRAGVLFMTHDTISEPLATDRNATTDIDDESTPLTAYDVFLEVVDTLRKNEGGRYPDEVSKLAPGPVAQPSLVHSVVSRDGWKLVRYFAPEGNVAEQYELYALQTDPREEYNLLVYNGTFPTPVPANELPEAHRHDDVEARARAMMSLLEKLETELLSRPKKVPSARG